MTTSQLLSSNSLEGGSALLKKKKLTWLEGWVGVEAVQLETPLCMLHCLFPQLQRPLQAVTACKSQEA